jgi:hypothetical protein
LLVRFVSYFSRILVEAPAGLGSDSKFPVADYLVATRRVKFAPCLPIRGPPSRRGKFHEIKHDSGRLSVHRQGKRVPWSRVTATTGQMYIRVMDLAQSRGGCGAADRGRKMLLAILDCRKGKSDRMGLLPRRREAQLVRKVRRPHGSEPAPSHEANAINLRTFAQIAIHRSGP